MPHVALPNRAQRSGVLRGARDVSSSLQYLRNTTIGNVLNLCGLPVPCGFTSQGFPIGLTIYDKPFQEDLLLRIGYIFEQATDWHRRPPDRSWVHG